MSFNYFIEPYICMQVTLESQNHLAANEEQGKAITELEVRSLQNLTIGMWVPAV